jgi:hypothetical protein
VKSGTDDLTPVTTSYQFILLFSSDFKNQIQSDFKTTLCDKDCQWFSPGTPISSNNKTDHHDITEILLKALAP